MKVKLLFKYIIEFLMGITISLLAITLILKFTILKEDYLLNKLEENNYYEELFNNIKEEMSYYVTQTGFDNNILDNVFTKEDVKNEVNKVITSLYNDKEVSIDTSIIKEKLNTNIDNYLKNTNKEVDKNSLDIFINQITDVYSSSLTFVENLNEYTSYINIINLVLNILLIATIIILILLSLYIIFVSKEIPFDTPLITLGILMIITNFLIKSYIDIDNIMFYNESISLIIKETIKDILSKINLTGIIGITLGIIIAITNGYILFKRKDNIK